MHNSWERMNYVQVYVYGVICDNIHCANAKCLFKKAIDTICSILYFFYSLSFTEFFYALFFVYVKKYMLYIYIKLYVYIYKFFHFLYKLLKGNLIIYSLCSLFGFFFVHSQCDSVSFLIFLISLLSQ